jgi:N-methylhydantoinase A
MSAAPSPMSSCSTRPRRGAVAKVPTTRPDQSGGFLDGIGRRSTTCRQSHVVVHGTTAGTNALLERKGARIGVITTARAARRAGDAPPRPARTWGLRGDFEPVVPRDLRLEVPERTLADGTIHTPVDLDAVRAAARPARRGLRGGGGPVRQRLCQPGKRGPRGRRGARALAQPHVSLAPRSCPKSGSSSAFSTTALNAYLQPEVSGYLDRLDRALTAGRVRRRVHDRAVQRRRHGVTPPAACRCARRCPARRRRHRRRYIAADGGLSRTSSPATWAAPASTSR